MYVIKSHWYRMPVYYIDCEYDNNGNITIRNLTEEISNATFYNDIDEAEKVCRSINNPLFKVYPVCPICNPDYKERPAISRYNNETLICSVCGIKEALEIFMQNKEGC